MNKLNIILEIIFKKDKEQKEMSTFGDQMHESDAILEKLDELDIMCEMNGI